MIAVELQATPMMPMGEGLRVNFPLHSATGTTDSATVLMELDAGGVLPEHRDSAEELLLVLEGRVEATIGMETATLGEGAIAVVPSMVPHGFRNAGPGRARVLGYFSSATVVSTFVDPMGPEASQVFVIGAPFPIGLPLGGIPVLVQ
jgi:quercetin dioxygenase-like cupin family protein